MRGAWLWGRCASVCLNQPRTLAHALTALRITFTGLLLTTPLLHTTNRQACWTMLTWRWA